MSLICIINGGKTDRIINNRVIPPGESLHFEEQDLPPQLRPAQVTDAQESDPEPVDPLKQLLSESVPVIKKELSALDDDHLAQLDHLEKGAHKPRNTLLGAIQEERLRRVNQTRM